MTDGETHWVKVEALFLEALDMTDEERRSFLQRLREEEPALADEVGSLVEAHEHPGFVDRLAEEGAFGSRDDSVEEIGARFGPYETKSLLGRGGMGVVYRATRVDGEFHQEVALKVLPAEFQSRRTHERFLAEREILARLVHPNIARLLHGGVDAKGRPYFAMELVEGETILKYCDDQRISLRDRVTLFIRICEAVQHAHQNLVVHRDLKPGNILITADGSPKLLDFGIGKILDDSGAFPTETQMGMRLLTPAYAAPEQLRGAPANTGSDIYQLGILLFELLTGAHPFPARRGGTADPVESQGPPTEPSRPSNAVTSTDPDSLTARALARSTTFESLERSLQGDLDAIVLKALRPDPADRYASASALAEDLLRYLEHRPVRARRDSIGYRTRLFARRNRSALAVSMAGVVGILAFVLGIAREGQRTALERDRAQAVSGFMTELFVSADPYAANRSDIAVRDVLDDGLERLRADRAMAPRVRADLLLAIGQAYAGLSMSDAALDAANEGLGLLRSSAAPAGALALATAQIGDLLTRQGRFDEARPLLLAADSLLLRPGVSLSERAEVAGRLGGAWFRAGEPELAASFHAAAAERHLEAGNYPTRAAGSLTDLAAIRDDLGDPDSADVLYRRALSIREEVWGEDHLWVSNTLVALAEHLHAKGELSEADSLFRRALAIRSTAFTEDHVALAGPWLGLAQIAASRGDNVRADSLFQLAIDRMRSHQGPDHFSVARLLNTRAIFLQRIGRNGDAEDDFRAAHAIFTDQYGADHPYTAVIGVNLAWVTAVNGNVDDAVSLYRLSLRVLEAGTPDDPTVYGYFTDYGIVLCLQGDPAGAGALETAVEALARLAPRSDRDLRARNALGSCLMGLDRIPEAIPILEGVMADTESRTDDPYRAFAEARLAEIGDIESGPGRDG